MRRTGGITFLILLLTVSGGCSRFVDYGEGYSQHGGPRPPPNYETRQPQNKTVTYHRVSKGDTLYSIAWQYGYDYRSVAHWNRITAPFTIYPGQRLRVRKAEKNRAKNRPTASVVTKNSQNSRKSSGSKRPGRVQSHQKKRATHKKISWRWPARGKVVSRFAAGDASRQGIDITGRQGQPIKAAAAGKVVYSGHGLRGYGNLVIIKHNETYFSAYAHNKTVFVRENEVVKLGQRIADMGRSGAEHVKLHFEIRKNGKPTNPLKYLPK